MVIGPVDENDINVFGAAQLGIRETSLSPIIERSQEVRHENQANFGITAIPWVHRNVFHPEGASFFGHAGGSPGYSALVSVSNRIRTPA